MLLLGMTNVRKRHILTVVLSLFVLPYCSSVTYLALNYTVRTFLTFLTMHRVGTQPCQLCLPHETPIPDTALVKFLFLHTLKKLLQQSLCTLDPKNISTQGGPINIENIASDSNISVNFVLWSKMFHANFAPKLVGYSIRHEFVT